MHQQASNNDASIFLFFKKKVTKEVLCPIDDESDLSELVFLAKTKVFRDTRWLNYP
jgi:hypothetical protein